MKNMVHTCVFKKITKIYYIFGKNGRKCFRSKYQQFQQISVQCLPFPHPDTGLITKDLTQIKVYIYFNIEDAQTLVKLKEK